MPKIQEFNIEDYNQYHYSELIIKELNKKMNEVEFMGARPSRGVSTWGHTLSESEVLEFSKTKVAKDLLKQYYEQEKQAKIEKYEKLKAKLDYCLRDVKPYQKLIANIEEFTYCGATTELEKMNDKYLKGYASSKSVYRARQQEFSKIKC